MNRPSSNAMSRHVKVLVTLSYLVVIGPSVTWSARRDFRSPNDGQNSFRAGRLYDQDGGADVYFNVDGDSSPVFYFHHPSAWLTSASKRAPWAPSEIRVDQLMQKLRSRMYRGREKHSASGGHEGRYTSTEEDEGRSTQDMSKLLKAVLDNRDNQEHDGVPPNPPRLVAKRFSTRDGDAKQDLFPIHSSDLRSDEEARAEKALDAIRRLRTRHDAKGVQSMYLGVGKNAGSFVGVLMDDDVGKESDYFSGKLVPVHRGVRFLGGR